MEIQTRTKIVCKLCGFPVEIEDQEVSYSPQGHTLDIIVSHKCGDNNG